MSLILTAGPLVEPVTLATARAHLRLDTSDEDDLVIALIAAARLLLEAQTARAFITQSWRWVIDAWPGSRLVLPIAPLQSVTSIGLRDDEGTLTPVDASLYTVFAGETGEVHLKAGCHWPLPPREAGGIEVAFTAGYGAGADDVPSPLRQAMLLLIAHWFEHREPVSFAGSAIGTPLTVDMLTAPYRRVRL